MEKRLYKSRTDKQIEGVCGGIAEYFGIDSTIIRLAWVLFVFAGGSGILAYIVMAIVMPHKPFEEEKRKENEQEIEEKNQEESFKTDKTESTNINKEVKDLERMAKELEEEALRLQEKAKNLKKE